MSLSTLRSVFQVRRMRERRWQSWCHRLIKPECRLSLQINRNADGCNTRLPDVSFNFASCAGCTQFPALGVGGNLPLLARHSLHKWTACKHGKGRQGGRKASRITTEHTQLFSSLWPLPQGCPRVLLPSCPLLLQCPAPAQGTELPGHQLPKGLALSLPMFYSG